VTHAEDYNLRPLPPAAPARLTSFSAPSFRPCRLAKLLASRLLATWSAVTSALLQGLRSWRSGGWGQGEGDRQQAVIRLPLQQTAPEEGWRV
jgi:hypothetical protein